MTKTRKPQTATCKRCKATLTSARSIARGRGAHCEREYRREQAVQTAGFKPAAVDKARQLIADTYHLRALKLLNAAKRELAELLALMLEGDVDPADPTFALLAQLEDDISQKAKAVARDMPDDQTTGLD